MNVKRFTAPNSREALKMVKEAFGNDAIILSTKPCSVGVEILAMPPESVEQIERMAAPSPAPIQPAIPTQAPMAFSSQLEASDSAKAVARGSSSQVWSAIANAARSAVRVGERQEPSMTKPRSTKAAVDADTEQLSTSSLSFQDYVRERMLKKRDAEKKAEAAAKAAEAKAQAMATVNEDVERMSMSTLSFQEYARQRMIKRREQAARQAAEKERHEQENLAAQKAAAEQARLEARFEAEQARSIHAMRSARAEPPILREELPVLADNASMRRDQQDMLSELKSMKGLIEERFGALAFMEKLQRDPAQARLTQKLLDCGLSPALIRKLSASMKSDVGDETEWASTVLQRNLSCAENEPALEDQGGVFALIGSTGVGKTTSTAKLAAAFATKHGASNLGLITLDAYRVGAHEQLRAYGRILGVPVHTAHDRASLEDLMDLLSAKKLVLIDTAGMGQRDSRTKDLLEMLSHSSIKKLLVVNAASQGETIEDVVMFYRANQAAGVVLSKIDEAVKLGPAIDAMIRHKLSILGVANGQRVPEDWHRLSAHALVQRALRCTPSSAFRMDAGDVNLIFAASHSPLYEAPLSQAHQGFINTPRI
jgi:flagellar biosynthesis protein FlhF